MMTGVSTPSRPQSLNGGIVYVPVTVPPVPGLHPACDVTVICAGTIVWHAGPGGTGIPATVRLVILIVTCDVAVIAPPFGLIVPVVCPCWMNSVVAVTGTRPSSVNDPVAGGSVRVPVRVWAVRSTVPVSVPGPRPTVVFGAFR